MNPPLFFQGPVIVGKRQGKRLGFPTANIPINGEISSGIYAGRAKVNGKNYLTAIYIGVNQKVLEAHLLGFNEEIYGQTLEVTIEKKIRENKKFENQSELLETISSDVKVVEAFYAQKT